ANGRSEELSEKVGVLAGNGAHRRGHRRLQRDRQYLLAGRIRPCECLGQDVPDRIRRGDHLLLEPLESELLGPHDDPAELGQARLVIPANFFCAPTYSQWRSSAPSLSERPSSCCSVVKRSLRRRWTSSRNDLACSSCC